MKRKGVLIIESQPPTAGEFLQLIMQLNHYDFIYICLNFTAEVMAIPRVLTIWKYFLSPYKKKTAVVQVTGNFASVSKEELPEMFKKCTYLTTNKAAFVHLSSMNVPVELIPRVLGYYSIFIRSAYRQSMALDWLEGKTINSANNLNKR